ncbi:hypothetical protein [Gelidibacter sp. F63206]|uniref:hypothetical protein n=1 Tax=Gelidibacter sp. F63206 TaxID=2926425 RepID=UPI001FF6CF0D|nr:hypothetical protein [Gelidibacter sp. F63206]MCK0114981.1 hypothetical protein [Gelidibacter sp. F63206]
MKNQYKFLGILRGRNFNFINNQLIEDLIKNEVIFEDHLDYGEPDSCPMHLCAFIYFNNKVFQLNEVVLEEIYSILKYYVEKEADFQYGLQPIFYKLNSIIDKDKKIKYLKKTYEKIYPKDWQTYSMYLGSGSNGIKSWKEWTFLSIEESPNLLKHFLTLPELSVPFETTEEALSLIESLHVCYHFMNVANENRENLDLDGFFNLLEEWKTLFEKENQLQTILNKIHELEADSNIAKNKLHATIKPKRNIPDVSLEVPISLQTIFDNDKLYATTIEKFIKEELFQVNGNRYKLLKPKGENNLSDIRWACAVGMKLKENNYFKFGTEDIDVVRALNYDLGLSLTKQNYNSLLKVRDNTKTQDYFSPLFFIN